MAIRVINGIGKGKVIATPKSGLDIPTRTFILPLTAQNGYTEKWTGESFIGRVINPDTLEITELPLIIKPFGNWFFDYAGLPKEIEFVRDIAVQIWNIQSQYDFTLYPKYESLIGLPERFYPVNFMEQDGLTFNTGDSVLSPGTFGTKMAFRTRTNQLITVGVAEGVLPGGGSVGAPFEGGM